MNIYLGVTPGGIGRIDGYATDDDVVNPLTHEPYMYAGTIVEKRFQLKLQSVILKRVNKTHFT